MTFEMTPEERARRRAIGGRFAPHAVYRFYDRTGRLLYVGCTEKVGKRLKQHRATKDWWPLVGRTDIRWYSDFHAARCAERRAIESEKPVHNVPQAEISRRSLESRRRNRKSVAS